MCITIFKFCGFYINDFLDIHFVSISVNYMAHIFPLIIIWFAVQILFCYSIIVVGYLSFVFCLFGSCLKNVILFFWSALIVTLTGCRILVETSIWAHLSEIFQIVLAGRKTHINCQIEYSGESSLLGPMICPVMNSQPRKLSKRQIS